MSEQQAHINRYPGIRSFKEGEQVMFFGRDHEREELLHLIKIKQLVVMFAKSGIGKTSLLNAGLMPLLQLEQIQPIKIRLQNIADLPIDVVRNELKPYLNESRLNKFTQTETSILWQYLKACNFENNGQVSTPILIFDQFEEFFTHKKEHRDVLAKELGDLISERLPYAIQQQLRDIPRRKRTKEQLEWFTPVNVKILLIIRSDKLSLLDELSVQIPSILKTRFHLKPLHHEQAKKAIVEPANVRNINFTTEPFKYSDIAIQDILDNLSDEEKEIESSHLQIICRDVEEKVKIRQENGEKNIKVTTDYLGGEEGIDNILHNFYENQIRKLKTKTEQGIARKIIEEKLIVDGKRISLPFAVLEKECNADQKLLDTLEIFRLIRAEDTKLGKTYEVSHDTLVPPILRSYELRTSKLLRQTRKILRVAGIIGLVLLSILGLIATSFYFEAQEGRHLAIEAQKRAEMQTQMAQDSAEVARMQRSIAQEQIVIAQLQRDTAELERILARNAQKEAERNLILARRKEQEAKMAFEDVKKLLSDSKSSTTDSIFIPEEGIPVSVDFEPEMIFIGGGTFTMGCTFDEVCLDDELPVHAVSISEFYICKFEITQEQWNQIMGNSPSFFSDCSNCPVENVNWFDIQNFINKLNETSGKNYRLPTEAEWEYAAKGGDRSRSYLYSGGNDLDRLAWYGANSGDKTHFVGIKQPNELGIHDMSGNVYEWCSDFYGDYSASTDKNPSGPETGQYRVIRGGSWFDNSANSNRVSYRAYSDPSSRRNSIGFRLAISK